MNCKDCKFWERYANRDLGRCEGVNEWRRGEPETARFEVIAQADDDQGLQSWLETGSEFGCTKFEPKLIQCPKCGCGIPENSSCDCEVKQ